MVFKDNGEHVLLSESISNAQFLSLFLLSVRRLQARCPHREQTTAWPLVSGDGNERVMQEKIQEDRAPRRR